MSEIVVIGSMAAFAVLPWLTPRFFRRFGDRPSELEAKFLLLCDGLSDALLLHPCGILRLRACSDGGACSFRGPPACQMMSKIAGVYPMTKAFGSPTKEGVYTTLMMSTGLTFGSISALFGLTHGLVTEAQYSYLNCSRRCERGRADPDCQRFLSPAAPPRARGRPHGQCTSGIGCCGGQGKPAMNTRMLCGYDRGGGKNAFQRWRMGSVSHRVVSYAKCTVIVVR